jgi:hypothetical protein
MRTLWRSAGSDMNPRHLSGMRTVQVGSVWTSSSCVLVSTLTIVLMGFGDWASALGLTGSP